MIDRLDHVQLAMPKGGEEAARRFYVQVLGFSEVDKPDALKGRGGVWFLQGAVNLHLGVEDGFRPARKAHPAFQVRSLTQMRTHLGALDIAFREDADLPGVRRVFVEDPFGNRIELLERTTGSGPTA
jgi:catechol 2,3-dioxygenase-like lactoylglutathione lyase family enzyme